MFKGILKFITQSFQRKLLLFNISAVVLTTVMMFVYLTNNFQTITTYALNQNTIGMQQTVEDYLTKYAQEKANSTWLQLKAAQDNLTVLGRTAQKIIDNYDEIRANPAIFDLNIFQTQLSEAQGALSSDESASVDALIPPAIASDPRAEELLSTSALLNLNMDAVYDANANNAFIYFVGDPDVPVTRAYPNYHLVEILGDEGLSLLFWKDYFAQNVDGWRQWYTDPGLQSRVPNPITVEPPYEDAAGQGMMVTMFYPLWNKETDDFAGAVAADLTLNQIIENVLSIHVARTGFAFLTNGKGEIIAMPEAGYELFDIALTETELGGLSYSTGMLGDSTDPAVQDMASALLASPEGVYRLSLGNDGAEQNDAHLVAFASLPSLSDSQYQEDRWRIVIAVPETEIFQVLYETDTAIRDRSAKISAISLTLAVAFLIVATLVSMQFSNSVTRDLRTLAQAADQVSAKNYDIELDLTSQDELGQLGRAFEIMTREIHDYTTNLETKVLERTADLQRANEEITRLNERLQDENVRLSAELDVARRLQMMVLPPDSETRAIHDLDIACYMQPADEVGGDYYDVLKIGDSVFLGIGDVTGHGLPAGVIMLMAQTSLLTLSQSGEQDMERILSILNRVLYQNIARIRENKSMTLAVIRYSDREFSLVGQHESVLICRTDGQVEEIDTMDLGFPVGLEDDIDDLILTARFQLKPGDVMLLYTDGITEAENWERQQFGQSRLTSLLSRYHQMDAREIKSRIISDVHAYIGKARIYDDISMLVVKQK